MSEEERLKNKIEKLQNELAEKIKEYEKLRGFPHVGNSYYCIEISPWGGLKTGRRFFDPGHSESLKFGNCFEFKKEADEFRNAIKKLMEFRIMNGGWKLDTEYDYGWSMGLGLECCGGRRETENDYIELAKYLNVLLKHYPADEKAMHFLKQEEENKILECGLGEDDDDGDN